MRQGKLVAVAVAVLCSAAPLDGQRPITLGLGGGASLPTGDFGDDVELGWNALATIALSRHTQPIGLRLDAAHNQFAFSDDVVADGSMRVTSGTLNLTYRLPMTNSPASPYLITGLGAYHSDCSDETCEGTTKYGWNVGIGSRFYVLFRSFLEARYHRTSHGDADVHYVAGTFAIVF